MRKLKENTKKIRSLALCAIAGLFFSQPALSSSVSATVTNLTYGSQTPTVFIKDGNSASEDVYAGAFTGYLGSGNNKQSFTAYCADIAQYLAPWNNAETYSNSSSLVTNFNATKASDLQRLVNDNYSKVNSAVTSAAFQLATWEILFEKAGASYTLSNGMFEASGGSAATDGALSLAQTWLNTLYTSPTTGNYKINYLTNPRYQDLIYMTPYPAPLPAAAWLFASAIVGFVSLTNRRKI